MVILIGGASHMARPSWRRGSWSDTATPCSRSACWRWGSSAAGRSSEPRGLQLHGDKLGQPRATYRMRQHGNRSMRLPMLARLSSMKIPHALVWQKARAGIGNAREERLQSEYGLTLARIHLTHYLVCRTEC